MNVLTENKFINKGKEFSQKLRKVILNEELKLTNSKLTKEEINLKNFNINIRKIVHSPMNNNDNNDIINSERIDKKNSLPLIKNNNKAYDSLKLENNMENEENDKKIGIKIKKNRNIEIKNFKNNCLNIHIKKHKKFNLNEVEKIVNSLINSPKNNLSEKIESHKKENKRFPREKMIDPLYYIKYNVNYDSKNKNSSQDFNQYIKEIEADANMHKTKPRLLNETRDINYGKIQIDTSNFNNNKINYKDIFENNEEPKNFVFGKNGINYYTKIRNKNYIRMNRNKKRLIMISKFKKLLNENYRRNNKDRNDKKFVESYTNKAINEYRSFDDRMKILLNNTKLTENNINQTSKYHEKLINRINHINKCYD